MDDTEIVFTRGVPPLESFPRDEIGQCFDHAIRNDATALQYGKLPRFTGHPALRELIAARYGVEPDEVLVSNGSLQLLDLLAVALVAPGDHVLVEEPCYDRAVQIFRRRGARVIGVPLDEDGIRIEDLESAVKSHAPRLLYLVPDFQNPAGVTLSAAKRRAVNALAQRHGLMVIEDIPYRDLRYTGEDQPLLRSFGAEHILTVGSFSKTICPGVRVGFMLASRKVIDATARVAEDTYLSPGVVSQAAVAEYLRRGHFEPNLARLRDLYRPRWQAAVAAVKELPVARAFVPEGGFFVSVVFAESANTTDLVARARARRLTLSPGPPFFADADRGAAPPPKNRFLRIAFQSVAPEQIREGFGRLSELLRH